MSLVAYSMKTKGRAAFVRRLWTVFTRFGLTERRTRRSVRAICDAVRLYGSSPTFFVPATVLSRSPSLIRRVQRIGAEIGLHGYAHNDYRSLSKTSQVAQIKAAMTLFDQQHVAFQGFRNPYLGWNEESLDAFRDLGIVYDSNEAVFHDILDRAALTPVQEDSLTRSLGLFQAITPSIASLRPHTESGLLRIPISIPDDEMLFDRLRLPARVVGEVWEGAMRRVYDAGGVYVLNLHPERGTLAQRPLATLLAKALAQPLPVWITRLCDIAAWWRERAATMIAASPLGDGEWWRVTLYGSSRASLIVRNGDVAQATRAWPHGDQLIVGQSCMLRANTYPGVALSPRTPIDVAEALREHGYLVTRAEASEAARYATWLDLPDGFGANRRARQNAINSLVARLERGDAPLARIGIWPDACHAALSITGDIDSVTIQDFFLRILEVRRFAPTQRAPWSNG